MLCEKPLSLTWQSSYYLLNQTATLLDLFKSICLCCEEGYVR